MILIKNAQIIDGTGKPPFRGDILIKADKISAIGSLTGASAETVINGLGLTATPGFIDAYSNSDHYLTLFTNPPQEDFLLQGVTTIIGGHCGSSLAPLLYGSLKSIRKWADPNQINVDWSSVSELKTALRRLKIGVNFATLIGHSTIRRDLIGEEIRDLTQSEMEIFKNTVSQALKEGALGLSAGLSYAHSRNVSYSEMKNLLLEAAKQKAVYAVHLRDEKEGLVNSVQETIKIAEETGVPAIISHLRPIIGWEKSYQEALNLINSGLDKSNVYFEMNPFDMSVIPIYTLLPAWAQSGPLETMLGTIGEKNHREQALKELSRSEINFGEMVIAEARGNNYLIGKNLKEFSENREVSVPEGLLLLMEITGMKSLLFYKNLNAPLLAESVLNPRSLIGSNSASLPTPQALKPERSINTFKKFLEIAAAKNVALPEAIKKITFVPAKIFGLQKRGAIAEGWQADLTLLENNQIKNVIVNGQIALQDGKLTNKLAGVPI